jgi:hypothetical protein
LRVKFSTRTTCEHRKLQSIWDPSSTGRHPRPACTPLVNRRPADSSLPCGCRAMFLVRWAGRSAACVRACVRPAPAGRTKESRFLQCRLGHECPRLLDHRCILSLVQYPHVDAKRDTVGEGGGARHLWGRVACGIQQAGAPGAIWSLPPAVNQLLLSCSKISRHASDPATQPRTKRARTWIFFSSAACSLNMLTYSARLGSSAPYLIAATSAACAQTHTSYAASRHAEQPASEVWLG